jgi:hypothetical protein
MYRSSFWIVLIGALCLAAGASAQSIEMSKAFHGGSPLMISATAFATKGNYADSQYFNPFSGSLAGTSAGDGCVQAPVYLPNGARVTDVWASVVDNDGSNDIYVSMYRRSTRSLSDVTLMASLHSSGQSTSVSTPSDVTITSPKVSLPEYAYYVVTCLPTANTKLISVRIYYEEAIFVDAFECGETWAWSSTSE